MLAKAIFGIGSRLHSLFDGHSFIDSYQKVDVIRHYDKIMKLKLLCIHASA